MLKKFYILFDIFQEYNIFIKPTKFFYNYLYIGIPGHQVNLLALTISEKKIRMKNLLSYFKILGILRFLLFEFISYLIYSIRFFCFKILIIERTIEPVSINIDINKPVLYQWQCCLNHICSSDNICQGIYLFTYKKPWTFPNWYWPWFNFNHTIFGIDSPILVLLYDFNYNCNIFKNLGPTPFSYCVLVFYYKN